MRLEVEQLAFFWGAAAQPRPLVVIGAGRWGRTLVAVAAAARGGAQHLALVARSNMADTREWRMRADGIGSLTISPDLDAALNNLATGVSQRPVAIVASRPADHAADVRACLARGLHTMVEKPLVANPDHAAELLQMAEAQECALALGVESSLLPAFHYAACGLSAPVVGAHLEWADPALEARHGQIKRVHREINALEDNLPHALSIFRIFATDPVDEALTAAMLTADGDRGAAALTSGGARLAMKVDRAAARRERHLRLDLADGRRVDLDFSAPTAILQVDQQPCEIPAQWISMFSTLRLEIGAFLAHADGRRVPTPLTEGLTNYVRLHAALLRALA